VLSGPDAAAFVSREIEVADVPARGLLDGDLQHLIEVAVVERSVPADGHLVRHTPAAAAGL
jgi:hypothetical protein